jgi:L-rhamnose mutarotase
MSTFYAVWHHFKAGKAQEWWPKMSEMMGDPERMQAFVAKQNKLGFHGHAFMPTSQEGDIFCIWEAQRGKTAAQFQDFIDGPDGPSFDCFNNDLHRIDCNLNGNNMPFKARFKEARRGSGMKAEESSEEQPAEDRTTNGSTFFMVHHHFKAGKANAWWPNIQKVMKDPKAWGEMVEAHQAAGFHNHSFMPTSRDGPAFCIWEAQPGKTKQDFTEFIDGPLGPGGGMMNNNVHQIDATLTGGQAPYKPHFEQLAQEEEEVVEEAKKETRRVFGSLSNIFSLGKSGKKKSKKNVTSETDENESSENGENDVASTAATAVADAVSNAVADTVDAAA